MPIRRAAEQYIDHELSLLHALIVRFDSDTGTDSAASWVRCCVLCTWPSRHGRNVGTCVGRHRSEEGHHVWSVRHGSLDA